MIKDGGKSSLRPCLVALWLGRAMPLTRVAAGLAAAALLGSLALAVAWTVTAAVQGGIQHRTFTVLWPPSAQSTFVRPGMKIPASMPVSPRTYTFATVDPPIPIIVLAVLIAFAAWLALLVRIFGPPRGTAPSATSIQRQWYPWLMPPWISLAVVLAAICGTIRISDSEFAPGEQRFLDTIVLMACGGLLLASWFGVIEQMQRRRFKPVLDASGQVDVRCPGCGYLLIGLRELRCPECGMQFTIDELIRAQRYDVPKIS